MSIVYVHIMWPVKCVAVLITSSSSSSSSNDFRS